MIIYRIILIIIFLSVAGTVHGSPQDYIDENKEDALKGAEVIHAKGNFVAVPIPISNPTLAPAWGFWHMGQFAADYRKLFAKRPSETLQHCDAGSDCWCKSQNQYFLP